MFKQLLFLWVLIKHPSSRHVCVLIWSRIHKQPYQGKSYLAKVFNFTFRYINDVLSHNATYFSECLHIIYPSEFEIRNTIETIKRLLGNLIFSFILTQMDNFNLKSIANVMISTIKLSTSKFAAVVYPLSHRMAFIYLN